MCRCMTAHFVVHYAGGKEGSSRHILSPARWTTICAVRVGTYCRRRQYVQNDNMYRHRESNPGFSGESLTWACLSGSGEFYTGKKSSILQQKSLTDCKANSRLFKSGLRLPSKENSHELLKINCSENHNLKAGSDDVREQNFVLFNIYLKINGIAPIQMNTHLMSISAQTKGLKILFRVLTKYRVANTSYLRLLIFSMKKFREIF